MNRRVKALLVLNGIKQKEIAQKNRVSEALVSLVISGERKSEAIRKAIADALGMKVKDLWLNDKKDSGRAGMTSTKRSRRAA